MRKQQQCAAVVSGKGAQKSVWVEPLAHNRSAKHHIPSHFATLFLSQK